MPTIYGDTQGVLGCFRRGQGQSLTGADSDSTTGEIIRNTLYGDAHHLRGHARGGADVLVGGGGQWVNNDIFGDAQWMSGFAQGGPDVIRGGSGSYYGSDRLRGDAQTFSGHARGGDDHILGGLGSSTTLIGDADVMTDWTRGGDDTLIGPVAHSLRGGIGLYGDALLLMGHARGGDDHIAQVHEGSDAQIFGDAATVSGDARCGDDTITGYASSSFMNVLVGDARLLLDRARGGDDVLVSAAGSVDRMWGDAMVRADPGTVRGRDDFVFAPGNGHDLIYDFEPGRDRIDLRAFGAAGVHGFGDLDIRPGQVSEPGGPPLTGSEIDLGGGNGIFVAGAAALGSSDFVFG